MNESTPADLPKKLGAPAERALAQAGIQSLHDLTRFRLKEIKQLHGVGSTAIKKLQDALESVGLEFAKG